MKDIHASIAAVDSLLGKNPKRSKKKVTKKAASKSTMPRTKKSPSKKTPVAAAKKRPAKKATPKKRTAKASTRRRAEGKTKVRARVKPGKTLTASQRRLLKLMATRENLKALNRVISQGHISADEVVLAIEEALVLKRVNKRMAETIAGALRDVFGVGEVIDIGEVPLAR